MDFGWLLADLNGFLMGFRNSSGFWVGFRGSWWILHVRLWIPFDFVWVSDGFGSSSWVAFGLKPWILGDKVAFNFWVSFLDQFVFDVLFNNNGVMTAQLWRTNALVCAFLATVPDYILGPKVSPSRP